MARQRRSRDWQERAFDEREGKRRDSSAGTSKELPDPLKVSTELPRRNSLRWTAVGLVLIVVVVIAHNGRRDHAPALTKSCTAPAMALSTTSTHQGSTVRWSVTGPPETALAITIGVARLVRTAVPGQLHAVPEAGHTSTSAQIAVSAHELTSSCTANGIFSVSVPKGSYTVQLFHVLNPSTTNISATPIEGKPLTVS